MRNSSAKIRRKLHEDDAVMQSTTYPDLVGGFLREHFGRLRGAEKMLARMAHCSPRTAENWLRGQCAPTGST